MTTATYNRRAGKTGRPLGFVDVVSKIVDTAVDALTTRIAARAAARRAAASNSEADRRAIEAAQVRRRADQHRHDSPGFAADLFAAADRHDLTNR